MEAQVSVALGHFKSIEVDIAALKAVPCPMRRGYSYLGVLLGEGLLTPTQAIIAFGDWTKPKHEDFEERTLWSLYNAVTESLKKGAPARILDRHAKVHDFFAEIRQTA